MCHKSSESASRILEMLKTICYGCKNESVDININESVSDMESENR